MPKRDFKTVRGHGIFDDDVKVYSEDASGNAVYSWTNVDKIYDSITAAGMRPLAEISFCPIALASAQTHINSMWYNNVIGNWNAPKDWNKWKALVSAFITPSKQGMAPPRSGTTGILSFGTNQVGCTAEAEVRAVTPDCMIPQRKR